MKKAIFFDIDGTLLDCPKGITDITPRVKAAIKTLQHNGHYVFIASGRPYAFLNESLLNFGFDGFILTNGSQVIIHNKLVYNHPLDKAFVKKCIYYFEKYNIQYVLQSDIYSYVKESYSEYYSLLDSFAIPRKYLKYDCSIEDVNIYKMEMLAQDDKSMKQCMNSDVGDHNCDYNLDGRTFEFYSNDDTKASGILKALKYLNIPLENSYAFGDGMNDIEMLETVGCGIAMGNAREEIKNHAKKVTATVQEDGIAVGIEKYINQ